MSSLLKVIVATVAGIGMLDPPKAMIAGKGADPEVGYLIDTEKEMEFPPFETEILSEFEENVALTEDGLGGRTPSS
jgi:hypothetical protein